LRDRIEKERIGLLVPHLAKGGAGRAVSRISKLLAQNYDVYIILFTGKTIDFEYCGKVVDLDLPSVEENLLQKLLRTKKRIKAIKEVKSTYKLVVVISFLQIANICNILGKSKKCKTVVSVRGSIFSHKADGISATIKSKIVKRLYKSADRIIAVSKLLRRNIIDTCGVKPEKIVTIYNPYNIEQIQRLMGEKIESDLLAFTKERIVVLAAGQLVFQKGFWHLIKAFSLLKTTNARLLICGEGYQYDPLNKLIIDLKLSESVKLLGFQKNVFKYMRLADVFVLSSITEGFPNVLPEAMACGTPIVSVDCTSGPREILVEKPDINKSAKDIEMVDYGVLVPPMSPVQNWDSDLIEDNEVKLAEALNMIIESDVLRTEYSSRAVERASAFSEAVCLREYCKVLDDVLERV